MLHERDFGTQCSQSESLSLNELSGHHPVSRRSWQNCERLINAVDFVKLMEPQT